MKFHKPLFPQLFKGIALFTPGGDLIYCIDPSKQGHWHLHLCVALQEILGLPEPPHFLVPGYTATIDRWLDPRTQQIQTSAEIYPLVRHHQALLNAIFGIDNPGWQMAPWQEGFCDPLVLETYRPQFPQLWEDHDLIVRFERAEQFSQSYREIYPSRQHHEVSSDNKQSKTLVNEEPTSSPYETTTTESASIAKGDAINPKNLTPEYITSEMLPSEQDAAASRSEEAAIPSTGFANAHNPQSHTKHLPKTFSKSSYPVTEAQQQSRIARSTTPQPSHQQTPTPVHSDSLELPPDAQLQHAQGYVLRLFVSGHSAATEYTLMSLHQLLEHSLRLPYSLKVIDVFKHPDQAEANQISATPTLLRVWPHPVRRIVGDLTDAERILRILAVPED
ncbi:MAG: hypothetical protein Fur006_21700 [Coleofasciculaceae cyanobacterium]